MTWNPTPWMVGGGAEHPVEVARMLAYAATGGADGVIEPNGLKVRPLATPGTSVRVGSGGCVMRNRYPGGGEQSYVGRNPGDDVVPIAATSSAAQRSDLVVARVVDPQYEGAAPSNPNAFQYMRTEVIQGVPWNADQAWLTANRQYPAIALARIELPPSTGTVQAQHITDLRALAQPRSHRVVEMGGPTADAFLTSSDGTVWPSFAPSVRIPAWATHVSVIATIAAVGYMDGSVAGTLAVSLGPAGASQWRSSNTYYDLDVGSNDGARTTLAIGGKGPIPTALRGTVQQVRTEGKRDAYTGTAALVTRPGTHVVFDVFFTEEPV